MTRWRAPCSHGGLGLVTTDRERPLRGALCLDWTERVPHVSGPLGVAICGGFLDAGWVARQDGGRALRVTARGQRERR
jgi:hypothetical protein